MGYRGEKLEIGTLLRKPCQEVPIWLSGLRIGCCHCSGLGHCEVRVQSLALEIPYAMHVAKTKKKKKTKAVSIVPS